MGTLDAAIERERSRPGASRSLIDKIREKMDDDEAEVLDAALRDLTLPASRLAAAMTEAGWPISQTPIGDWRRRNVAR